MFPWNIDNFIFSLEQIMRTSLLAYAFFPVYLVSFIQVKSENGRKKNVAVDVSSTSFGWFGIKNFLVSS